MQVGEVNIGWLKSKRKKIKDRNRTRSGLLSLSSFQHFVTPWTAAQQASLSFQPRSGLVETIEAEVAYEA